MTLPADVTVELAQVRKTGEVNMFDYHTVQRLAFEMDCHALIVWMDEVGLEEYGHIILTGNV